MRLPFVPVRSLSRVCALGLMVTLMGCMPDNEASAPLGYGLAGYDPNAEVRAEESCLARGGTYGTGGAAGLKVCYETPKDAGKSCSKSTDCESQCLARSKSCAPLKPVFGCSSILDSLGREVTLCTD
ncbi:hypothetical protein EDD53_0096 [Pacificibacter maritimus]|uniref:Uncharacterized protein n=1 Tax=Pacificibacter maritimus TaxID=762213 RepID=A0A3N4UKL7_9RHOB|nr:hypothetical protein [Pacificibacter maritimus]RPE70983.1 hypothetical protein EDD53_0096 [Pacificibacter maritimus]